MDEVGMISSDDGQTVGEKLRAAREAKKLSIEDIAAQTRIPTRHLQNLEDSAWDRLPAPTYTMGFAKAYAGIVGLDRDMVAEQLRHDLGGWTSPYAQAEVFEPADPKRAMPMWLVLGGIVAIALVVALASWLNRRGIEGDDSQAPVAQAENVAAAPAPAPAAVAPAGQVSIVARDTAWFKVTDGTATLYQGELAKGQRFDVPATAAAPMLQTARPEALQILVNGTEVAAVGTPGKSVSGVSLKADALTAAPAAASTPTVAPPPVTTAPRPTRTRSSSAAPSMNINAATTAPAPAPAPVAATPAPTGTTPPPAN